MKAARLWKLLIAIVLAEVSGYLAELAMRIGEVERPEVCRTPGGRPIDAAAMQKALDFVAAKKARDAREAV